MPRKAFKNAFHQELQKDSFIAQIDPNIFDTTINNTSKIQKSKQQLYVLNLNVDDSDSDCVLESTQTILAVDKEQDKSQGDLIDLWASQEQDKHKLQHESRLTTNITLVRRRTAA